MQAWIYHWFSIKGNPYRVHGWIRCNCRSATAEGSSRNQTFHQQDGHHSCFEFCLSQHRRGSSSLLRLTALSTLLTENVVIFLQWSWQTIVMGICFLVFLLGARHVVCFYFSSFYSLICFHNAFMPIVFKFFFFQFFLNKKVYFNNTNFPILLTYMFRQGK